MVYGKPIINTRLPTGVPWVSVHNETGLTVKVNDSSDLAQAIQKLYFNEELVDKLGKGAIARVNNLFSSFVTNKQIYNIYFRD